MSAPGTTGERAGDGPPVPLRRREPFGLPAETTFLFVLLVSTLCLSCLTLFGPFLSVLADVQGWVRAFDACLRRLEHSESSGGPDDFLALLDRLTAEERSFTALQQCIAPVQERRLLWQLGSLALVFGMGVVLYLAHPLWYVRRHRLSPFDPRESTELLAELSRLRRLAGVGPVRFLNQPFNPVPSAFVFGLPRRRALVLSTGLVVRAHTDPAAFRATVLHELAHLRNRDIEPTYLALTLTAVFGLVLGAFSAWSIGISGSVGSWMTGTVVRALVLGLLALLLLAALVRSREFQADARVRTWGADGAALPKVLGDMPVPPRRALAGLRALHPTPARRVLGLSGGALPFGLGYWGGTGAGLTAAVTLMGLQSLVMMQGVGLLPLWVAVIPAALVAAVTVVGRWRYESAHPGGAPRRTWPFGLGLATGIALGPLVSLELAAVRPNPLGLLLWLPGWMLLVAVMTAPVSGWVTEGVAGWRSLMARAARGTASGHGTEPRRRVPAALLVAVAVATVVYTVLLRTLQVGFHVHAPHFREGTELAGAWWETRTQFLLVGGLLEADMAAVALGTGAVLVVLLALGAARVRTGLRNLPGRRGVLLAELRHAVWAGLAAGGLTLLLVLLAVLQAHRMPLLDRWHNEFTFLFWMLTAVSMAAVGALAGLVTTWRSRRWPLACGALTALTCAVVGLAVLAGWSLLTSCVDAFAARPSVRSCPTPPTPGYLWLTAQVVIGSTTMAAVVLLPLCAAVRARLPQTRRPRRRRWYGWAALALVTALGLSSAGYVVAHTSRHVPPVAGASSGDGGWVDGDGYRLRMPFGWYDVAGSGDTGGGLHLWYSGFAFRTDVTVTRITGYPIDLVAPELIRDGGHRTTVAGAKALVMDGPGRTEQERARIVLVEHGEEQLRVGLRTRVSDWETAWRDLDAMLASWQWTSDPG